MVIVWLIISGLLLLIGVYRLHANLREFLFVETAAHIVRSEPVCLEQDESDIVSTYYPAVEFSYTVDGKQYVAAQNRFPGGSASLDYDHVREICDDYRRKKQCKAWYDPRYPSVAILNRTVDSKGFMFFGAGSLCLLLALFEVPLRIEHAALVLLSVAAIFFIILNIEEVIRDSLEIGQADDPGFVSCKLDDIKNLPVRFVQTNMEALHSLGFEAYGEFTCSLYAKYGFRNYIAVFVSKDKRTMATVGCSWYTKRFLGIFPLPFLGVRGVDFDSRFSNDSLLTTTQNALHEKLAPPGCRKVVLSEELSLGEVFEKHNKELEEVEREESLRVELFANVNDCLDYLRLTLAKIKSHQSQLFSE